MKGRGATVQTQSDVQVDSLANTAEEMGLGNVVVAEGHTYDSRGTHLIDDVRAQGLESSSTSFEARIPHADEIKVTSDFIVTTDLRK